MNNKKKTCLLIASALLMSNAAIANTKVTGCDSPTATTCELSTNNNDVGKIKNVLSEFTASSITNLASKSVLNTTNKKQIVWEFDQGGELDLKMDCKPLLNNKLGQSLVECNAPTFAVKLPENIYSKGVATLSYGINSDQISKPVMVKSVLNKNNSYTLNTLDNYVLNAALKTYVVKAGDADFEIHGTYTDGKAFNITAPVTVSNQDKEVFSGKALNKHLQESAQFAALNEYIDSDKAASNINAYYYGFLSLAMLLGVGVVAGIRAVLKKHKNKNNQQTK